MEALRKRALATDANDMLYQFEASMDYNPSPLLETIKAPLYAVNAADDEVNPPELGLLDREADISRSLPAMKHAATEPNSRAVLWEQYLEELLKESKPGRHEVCQTGVGALDIAIETPAARSIQLSAGAFCAPGPSRKPYRVGKHARLSPEEIPWTRKEPYEGSLHEEFLARCEKDF